VTEDPLDQEILTDLFRSAWIIEAARADLYSGWSQTNPHYESWRENSLERQNIIEKSLQAKDGTPDPELVEAHSRWMMSLAGNDPDEVPLGALFLSRLGAWVRGHVSDFLVEGADRLAALCDEDDATLTFPERLPEPPPFEPVHSPQIEPPGDVLFRFGILSDLHIGSRRGDEHAEAAISDLNESGAELVIQLGDITDHGNKDEYDLATEALGRLQMPVVTMMGNHDVFSIAEERLSGREYYESSFGRAPDGVLLEHQGFRFAVLDSVEHSSSPIPAFDFVSGSFIEGHGGAIVRGSLTPAQHDLLAEIAAPDSAPTFLFLHHPPQPFTGFPPVLFGLRDSDSGRLHATIDSGNVWGVFAGHTHRNARTRNFDGVPAQEVAMPRDYPFGYALVDVTTDGYAFRFEQLSDLDLLEGAYRGAGVIHRRYGRGADDELAFVWRRN
jgi:hypothetical protein